MCQRCDKSGATKKLNPLWGVNSGPSLGQRRNPMELMCTLRRLIVVCNALFDTLREPLNEPFPFARALPTETKVESGTSQSKNGTSVNLSNSGKRKPVQRKHLGTGFRSTRDASRPKCSSAVKPKP